MLCRMLTTSARLLRLLSLLQVRRFWSGADLAERMEVTERTVRRDVDKLRELGYPVNSTSGVAGGYQLGAGSSLPPLLLDDDEALAVAVGLRTAAAGTISGMEEAALRALSKLEQVLPPRLRRAVRALHASVVPAHLDGPAVDPELLTQLAHGCRDHTSLQFGYQDRLARATTRSTEPLGLVHTGSRWYLVAWDVDRADFRTFRVDRITTKAKAGRRFVPREIPGGDLAGFVAGSAGTRDYPYQASVVFQAPLELVQERIPANLGRLLRVDHQRTRFEFGGHSIPWMGVSISLVDVDFEVEAPPELVNHVAQLAARYRRATLRTPRTKNRRRRAESG